MHAVLWPGMSGWMRQYRQWLAVAIPRAARLAALEAGSCPCLRTGAADPATAADLAAAPCRRFFETVFRFEAFAPRAASEMLFFALVTTAA